MPMRGQTRAEAGNHHHYRAILWGLRYTRYFHYVSLTPSTTDRQGLSLLGVDTRNCHHSRSVGSLAEARVSKEMASWLRDMKYDPCNKIVMLSHCGRCKRRNISLGDDDQRLCVSKPPHFTQVHSIRGRQWALQKCTAAAGHAMAISAGTKQSATSGQA